MLRLQRYYSSKAGVLTTIRDLLQIKDAPQGKIEIKGWIKSIRRLKKVSFIDLHDGTTSAPLNIVLPNVGEEEGTIASQRLKVGQSLKIENATLCLTPTREQPFELSCSRNDISVLGDVTSEYPLQKKYTSLAQLRRLPLWKHRTTYFGGLMRIRSHVETKLNSILAKEGLFKVQPPILTSSDCEGGGQLFNVEANALRNSKDKNAEKYFGKDAYLSVSTQLHLEILAHALSKVWTLTPCFRAEESDTNRHLAEFWMLEVEMCNIETTQQLTDFIQLITKRIAASLIENQENLLPKMRPEKGADERQVVIERWNKLLDDKWHKITYTDAIKVLQHRHAEKKFETEPLWGVALKSEHEKWLAGEHFQGPVFVTDYPKQTKAFYMKQNPDGETVACFDLLVPDMGEIVGGSVREDDYDKLISEMKLRKMDIEALQWYTELRRQGSMPHGGFGIGIERLVSWLYGAQNIRDAIPFHRTAKTVIEL
ncbi:HDL125Cp [Eremothecium sinecaudum]|uniref:Asparagine--tRNA ligase, mitochondrial n=1 Tax=Eremothecium sinecaudum TaxID=45286 RepID=A0A0X8HSH5_9SACH|nr:HDL125Cp [Eremothecium sinecaudum]AMD20619.1 HDL125Cp [Eremothecium sinecaudum]